MDCTSDLMVEGVDVLIFESNDKLLHSKNGFASRVQITENGVC